MHGRPFTSYHNLLDEPFTADIIVIMHVCSSVLATKFIQQAVGDRQSQREKSQREKSEREKNKREKSERGKNKREKSEREKSN